MPSKFKIKHYRCVAHGISESKLVLLYPPHVSTLTLYSAPLPSELGTCSWVGRENLSYSLASRSYPTGLSERTNSSTNVVGMSLMVTASFMDRSASHVGEVYRSQYRPSSPPLLILKAF
jgi:hypothetical protein